MVKLGFEIFKKMLVAVAIVSIFGKFFDQLLTFGENEMQTAVVLTCYVYCIISLFSFSRHKLFHVLAVPVLTQFLHLFQKYSFPAGANSIWRLMPFLILICYFLYFFIQKSAGLSKGEKLFLASWIILQTFYLLISPNLANIAFGGLLLFLLTLPCYFSYLKVVSAASHFQQNLEMYLCTLYIILGFGTFGLVIAGAGYKGSDNLLATRNITDTNVTMAYFILLWPFVLLYAARNGLNILRKLALSAIFLNVVIFSFSRGAVLLIAPYMLVTIFLIGNAKRFWSILLLLTLVISLFPSFISGYADWDMAYFWTLRFGDIMTTDSVLNKLQQASGRAEIHEIAYNLFLSKPLTGHGTGSFEVLGPGYREAHSLFYTLLAENGLIGLICLYSLLFSLLVLLLSVSLKSRKHALMPVSLLFYLAFNHTVGSVFVILPAKSVTINCLAPILLMCLYFYANSIQANIADPIT
ncbi:O-antigen ligase family protein [Dyadobacter fanqingshengii]|uniref:O-antigen ligase family protein n=1 Tax=Dyadobacter fanqingshengii TaxID=2906443 RepID=A0A9X1PF88_9BACT|nr:O-antigen ligase family protein [Dyadobacter fanqingshengii]MCF0042162.1 O-antigen ligase family protein [Dyadobacter fanqingshengii]USJ35306.1 O-antigen ligase family protein [Dyadobacter fanqingshengii]